MLNELGDLQFFGSSDKGENGSGGSNTTNSAAVTTNNTSIKSQNTFVDNGDGTITTYIYDSNGTCYESDPIPKDSEEAKNIMNSDNFKQATITIGKYTIPYVTATTNGKIRFPVVDKEMPIMGLPPMAYGATTSVVSSLVTSAVNTGVSALMTGTSVSLSSFATGFIKNTTLNYDSYQQAMQSFPILKIQPLTVEHSVKQTNKGVSTSVTSNKLDVSYRFAVDPQNLNISYSHTNNFQESGIESSMKTLMQSNTVNELNQFMSTSGGMFGSAGAALTGTIRGAIQGAESYADRLVSEISQSMQKSKSMADYSGEIQLMETLGNVMKDTFLKGGRIDFPNIWTDAQTSNSQTFTIHLRTLSSDPSNKQYWREIILPLYCLMTLGLPPGGSSSTYSNPPYITCNLDNGFYEVLLGGITSISWEFPASEFNFLKVPRHVAVNLTVTDMYNIMSQDVINSDTQEVVVNNNLNFTTKDKLIDRFVNSTEGKSVYNSTALSTEYNWGKVASVLNTVSTAANVADALLGTDLTGSLDSLTGSVTSGITSTTTSIGTSLSSALGGHSLSPLARTVSSPLQPLDNETPLLSSLGINFEGKDASAGVLNFETSDGIIICTCKNVKNVVPMSFDASVAVKDLVSGKEALYISNGFGLTITTTGSTPEISPSFLTGVASKVDTSLRNLLL